MMSRNTSECQENGSIGRRVNTGEKVFQRRALQCHPSTFSEAAEWMLSRTPEKRTEGMNAFRAPTEDGCGDYIKTLQR